MTARVPEKPLPPVVYRAALAVVLVAVLAVILLQGRGSDQPSAGGPAPTGPVSPSASSTAPVATDQEFCDRYRALADAQAQYVAAGAAGDDNLRAAAHALVDGGVPASMSVVARTGYYLEVAGVYQSIGDQLDRSAVPGALDEEESGTSLSGTAGEFGAWLAQYCPA